MQMCSQNSLSASRKDPATPTHTLTISKATGRRWHLGGGWPTKPTSTYTNSFCKGRWPILCFIICCHRTHTNPRKPTQTQTHAQRSCCHRVRPLLRAGTPTPATLKHPSQRLSTCWTTEAVTPEASPRLTNRESKAISFLFARCLPFERASGKGVCVCVFHLRGWRAWGGAPGLRRRRSSGVRVGVGGGGKTWAA